MLQRLFLKQENVVHQQDEYRELSDDWNDDEEKSGNPESDTTVDISLDLVVSAMQCGVCDKRFPLHRLYVCSNLECRNSKHAERVLCKTCGAFIHNQREGLTHTFCYSERYVKKVADLICPDEASYRNGKRYGWKIKIPNAGWVEQTLFRLRCVPSPVLCYGGQISMSLAFNHALTVQAACDVGKHVVSRALVPAAFGASGGFFTAVVLEFAYIVYQYKQKRLTKKQCNAFLTVAIGGNFAAGAMYFLLTTAGAALFAPGIGWVYTIGAVIVAALTGLFARWGIQKIQQKAFAHPDEAMECMEESALEYFALGDDFAMEGTTECKQKISKKYHLLALKYHIDGPSGGDAEEWKLLSVHYGVLIGMWNHMSGRLEQNLDELSEEQIRFLEVSRIDEIIASNDNADLSEIQ